MKPRFILSAAALRLAATSTFALSFEYVDWFNGPVQFKGVENVSTPTAFLQIQGDKIELVWPASIQTAPYRPKTSW